jgi:prevent-host-death family protein
MVSRRGRKTRAARPQVKPRRGLPSNPANDRSRVGVRELRQNLSVFLDRVKDGETLTVTEHGQVVAVLAPALRASASVLERLVADGRATAPGRRLRDVPSPRRAPSPGGSGESVLTELREERLP